MDDHDEIVKQVAEDLLSGETSLEAIVRAKLAGDGDRLTEASLNRIWKQWHEVSGGPRSFAILSAYRHRDASKNLIPEQTNRENHKQLVKDITSLRSGWNPIIGYWPDDETHETVRERSIWVNNILRDDAVRLGHKYQQQAIIHCGPESGGNVHLIYPATGVHNDLGTFHPGRIAQSYSEIKGKPFVFEWAVEGGMMERIQWQLWERRLGVPPEKQTPGGWALKK